MCSAEMTEKVQVGRKRVAELFLILFGISVFLLEGCLAKRPNGDMLNKQLNIFDLALFAANDDKSIHGIVPKKEPCLKGFDYVYDPLEITVGYGTNDRVRKITTRNKETSMFDIHVGDAYTKGKTLILQAGFAQGDTPYRFVKDRFLFTLLVDDQDRVFGMAIEVLH
jgi:hypothetical protein